MKCLIHSHPGDVHAIAVDLALRSRGHRSVRDIGLGVSNGGRIEMRFGDGQFAARREWRGELLDPCDVDVVWLRRPVRPRLPEAVHPADRAFAAGEWAQVTMAFHAAADQAFWVNPLERLSRATNKPAQLRLAQQLGLEVPETLVTNDVGSLRSFLEAHENVVFKPLHGALWEVDGRRLGAYTSSISLSDLEPAERIEACPGIYQARVAKAFEVRAQFFGASCFAVSIDSQQLDVASTDWRRARTDPRLECAPIELPETVAAGCRAMMRALGIVAGAFDFIVTPGGEWIFLEVNEAGQFVFLEMWCPQLPVLDGFVRFLESMNPDFEWVPPRDPLKLETFVKSAACSAAIADDQTTWGNYRHPGLITESS